MGEVSLLHRLLHHHGLLHRQLLLLLPIVAVVISKGLHPFVRHAKHGSVFHSIVEDVFYSGEARRELALDRCWVAG